MEGQAVGSHSAALSDRSFTPIRLIVQPGGMSERCALDLLSSDYIADLRAEIVKWWEDLNQVIINYSDLYFGSDTFYYICLIFQVKNRDDDDCKSPNSLTTQNPIRIITQGQELTTDCDEKTLGEMGLKDNQVRI